MKCRNCGEELSGAEYCIYCGFPCEKEKSASSGKRVKAVMVTAGCFMLAAILFLLLTVFVTGKASRSPSGGHPDTGESENADETVASTEISNEEENASASELTDLEIVHGVFAQIMYIRNFTQIGQIDSRYAVDADPSLIYDCDRFRKDKGSSTEPDVYLLAREQDKFLLLTIMYWTTEYDEVFATEDYLSIVYKDGQYLLAPWDQDFKELREKFESEAEKKALEIIRSCRDEQYEPQPEFLAHTEEAFDERNFQWIYQSDGFNTPTYNRYLLYSIGRVTYDGILVHPICYYSSWVGSGTKYYMLIFVWNGTDQERTFNMRVSRNNGKLRLEYNSTDGNNKAKTESGKYNIMGLPVEHETAEFIVLEATEDLNGLGLWNDEPMQIYVTDTSEEPSN